MVFMDSSYRGRSKNRISIEEREKIAILYLDDEFATYRSIAENSDYTLNQVSLWVRQYKEIHHLPKGVKYRFGNDEFLMDVFHLTQRYPPKKNNIDTWTYTMLLFSIMSGKVNKWRLNCLVDYIYRRSLVVDAQRREEDKKRMGWIARIYYFFMPPKKWSIW